MSEESTSRGQVSQDGQARRMDKLIEPFGRSHVRGYGRHSTVKANEVVAGGDTCNDEVAAGWSDAGGFWLSCRICRSRWIGGCGWSAKRCAMQAMRFP